MASPRIVRRAKRLRQIANSPEQIAWRTLRKLRPLGFPVRRQHVIGPYSVDFAIERVRLVIEIDGGIHNLPAVTIDDADRQSKIEALGWRVLRIEAETAMSPDHLWAAVTKALNI